MIDLLTASELDAADPAQERIGGISPKNREGPIR
jgi:hypothetical protein